jgi:rhamnogalacturonyl hydrolase YesR
MSVKGKATPFLVLALVALGAGATASGTQSAADPLAIARLLAAKYPASPVMSYIPALAWSSTLRLAVLSGEEQLKEKPRADMQPFLSGSKRAIAEPYQLTSLAGHLAFADLGTIDGNKQSAAMARKAADFILADDTTQIVKFRRNWTDDMYMATSLLARVAVSEKDPRYASAVGKLLIAYAGKLQRPDGLFIHATEGPHAWGRGNGFALLGLADSLALLPADWPDRASVLAIYRTHIDALRKHQSDDGAWREVVDEPTSYRELTVTAMTVAAMARGVRFGWLNRDVMPVIDRGWQAVAARVNADGTVKDVCSSTGAGPTKEYYLNRPAINGADDRGGAMALLAAIEILELQRR